MKKNGFSIVEMLVAIIIVASIIVLLVPAYVTITESVKQNTYTNKVRHLESETLKYANNYKDDIKNNNCIDYTIDEIISKGLIESDEKGKNVVVNPVNGQELSGVVRVCYCPSVLDITSNYIEVYDSNKYYHKDDKVINNNVIYICIKDIPEIKSEYGLSNTEYFKQVEC